ncbi:hypothetical protein [Herminiimonas arsenitoxidans]|uniref:hypothetical protein n=1 Tax=Herminiimonas arsenitoxidans TaxID=1809410 RepID=UPI0009708C9B|nr:hypothetical protein [Herminiimonas arsenitoxidans]
MARKEKAAVASQDSADHAALAQGTQSLVEVSANAAAVSELIGYTLPYDRDRIVQEAKFYLVHSTEAMLEAGKRFLLLKENENHGAFLEVVQDQLGMDVRLVQKMMQAAAKYLSNPAIASNAKALSYLGKTKLYELMVMDDETIAEIAAGGTINGLNLDAIDQMTTRELKEALREANATQEATERVLAGKNKKIDQVERLLERRKAETPEAEWEWAPFRKSAIDAGEQLASFIQTELRKAFLDIQEHGDQGSGVPEDVDAVREAVLVGVMKSLVAIQNDFGIHVDLDGVVTPAWMPGQTQQG